MQRDRPARQPVERHADPLDLRPRPRPQRRQLRAADAAVAHRAHRVHLAGSRWRWSTASAATPGPRPTRARAGSPRRCAAPASARATPSPSMLANTPEMVEAHFGVPMTGGVLNTLNTRLDAEAIAFMLDHGEAKVLVTDSEFAPTIAAALARVDGRSRSSSTSTIALGPGGERLGDDRLRGVPRRRRPRVRVAAARRRMGRDLAQLHVGHHRQSEGRRLPPSRRVPERAVQHPRLGHAAARGVPVDAADVPLQRLVLPVDDGRERRHQRVPAQGRGARRSSTRSATHKVTHYCGAPIVHSHADQRAGRAEARASRTRCSCLVAAAAPPAAMIEGMERMGFDITHVYGLTETYGRRRCARSTRSGTTLDIGARTRAQRPAGRALHVPGRA